VDRFAELLWDLGDLIDLPLHVDKHRSCRLVIDETIAVQMELDSAEEFLKIGLLIAEIPPGKYREKLLMDALKANSDISFGALGYIAKNNSLTLSDSLFVKQLTGKNLADYLEGFVSKAKVWKEAIESGSSAPIEEKSSSKPSPLDLK